MKEESLSQEQEPVVVIKDLWFSRGSRPIFRGVDFIARKGKITVVMGPSGTGKTTLLKLIAGQLQPDKGRIFVKGQDVGQITRNKLFDLRKCLGMLFQSGSLFNDMTVFENVAFPLREHTKLPETMIRDLVLLKLEAVGLRGAMDLYPRELSGGMAQRVALARTIALDPELILYDEPFSGQDPISMGVLEKLVRLMNRSLDATTVIVSHHIESALELADYIYILSNGRVIGHGSPTELRASTCPQVQQFICGQPDGPVAFHYPGARFETQLFKEES